MPGADAQFAIDIAAQMPDGQQTLAELDAMTRELMGAGRGADHFYAAMKQVGAGLADAKAQADAAKAALGAGNDEYKQLEKAADKAAKAVERAARRNEGIAPPELVTQMDAAKAAVDGYAIKLAKLEREAVEAATAQTKLSRTYQNLGKLNRHVTNRLGDATTRLSTFRGALGDVGGPLGEFGEQLLFPAQAFVDLNEYFGRSTAAMVVLGVGFVALGAAVVALTALFVAGTLAIAKWAVGLADARRETELTREALEAVNPGLAETHRQYRDITNATGVASDRLDGLAKSLQDAKVSADDLPEALRAAAIAEAALGQGGASKFIADIKAGKLAVGDFANEVEQKFGGIVERKMMGLEAQGERLRRNIAELFSGLEIGPVLEGMQILVGLFDESTVAGQTMKFLFETIFQPIIDQAQNAAYAVEAFALGFLIGLTKVYIAIKPAIKAIGEFFGFEDTSLENVLGLVTKAGEYAAYIFIGFVAILGVLAAAIAAATAAGLAFVGILIGFPALIIVAGKAVAEGLTAAIQEGVDWLRSLDLMQVGTDMIMGLVRGISQAGPNVFGAMSGVVQGAVNAAKRALGIASPSKVFMGIADDTVEGFTGGVDDRAEDAQSAMARMVEPPESPLAAFDRKASEAAPSTRTPEASAGGSASVDLDGVTFNFFGVKDAEQGVDMLRRAWVELLEGTARKMGRGPEAAPA